MRVGTEIVRHGAQLRRCIAAAVGLWLCGVGTASANPFDVYGLGSRSSALGNAGAAVADDYTATYYNPSGLAFAKSEVQIGVLVTSDVVNIRLKDRPDGYDLPDVGNKSPAIPSKYRLTPRGNTTDIPNTYNLQMGGVLAPGMDQLRLGFVVGLPLNSLGAQTSRFADEREQYFSNRLDFELLGQRQQAISVQLGAAYRVTNWLAVGVGTSMQPSNGTTAGVYLADPTKQDKIDMVVHNDQKWNFALNAGLTVLPTENLKLALAWRAENYFDFTVQNDLQIKGFQGSPSGFPTIQATRVVVNYSPHQVTAGASYKWNGMLATADVIRSFWNRYLDTTAAPAGFVDTWSVRVGGQMQATEDSQLFAGLRYEQSPVPEQTGRTNYVDNDRVGVSAGARHQFKMGEKPFEVGWFISVQRLLARDTNKAGGPYEACAPGVKTVCDEVPDSTKDPVTGKVMPQAQGLQTGNPGWPGFQSWGTILAAGVDVKVPF